MKRAALQRLVHFLLKTITRTEYLGADCVPTEGPIIIATNHLSLVDTPVLFNNPKRPDITALVTTKYQQYAFVKWFVNSGEGIWIDRDTADFGAFRRAVEALKRGLAVGISPEGTRSHDGQLQEGKPGAVLLALRSNVPIVPVALTGTERAVDDFKHLRVPHMIARFGPAFTLPELNRDDQTSELKRYTDEIMCRIAALLPEQYRGFYRNFPRVKELVSSTC
ncbi:MAG TPA: lysophospholipid acyltransferase family protein [Longilinea sp.]|nr:lysophospholipid acyltransferase family protein [Longilinea sp.]